jgi:6-phospho-3-hexuloisomerase
MTLQAILEELSRNAAGVEQESIDRVVDTIRRARSVTLTGQGRSGYVAHMVAMRLMHLGIDAHAWGEATAPRVGEGAALIAVSGSGGTPVTMHFAQVAKDAGATLVAVVRSRRSPLGELADIIVEIPPRVASRQPGGSMFEQTALLTLDAVVLGYAAGIPDAAARLADRHTNLQ